MKRTCHDDPWPIEENKSIKDISDTKKALTDTYLLNSIKSQQDFAKYLVIIYTTLLSVVAAIANNNEFLPILRQLITGELIDGASWNQSITGINVSPVLIILIAFFISTSFGLYGLYISLDVLKTEKTSRLMRDISTEYLDQIAQGNNRLIRRNRNFVIMEILCVIASLTAPYYFYHINGGFVSGDTIGLIYSANMFEQLNEPEKVINLSDRILETDPSQYSIWNMKGSALADIGKYDEAIRCFDNVIEIKPNNSEAWHNKGNALRNIGEFNKSLEAHENSISLEKDPIKLAQDYNSKGSILTDLGKYDEAIKCYNIAIKSDNASNFRTAMYWNNKGNALGEIGKYNESIEAFNKAIEMWKTYKMEGLAWNNKGRILYKYGKYNESKQAIDKSIEIFPELSSNWNDAGIALYQHGKYYKAIECFEEAIRSNPQNAVFWDNKGNSLSNLHKYDEAIQAYDKAIEINPLYARAWNDKGLALKLLGRAPEANAAFDKARELVYTSGSYIA